MRDTPAQYDAVVAQARDLFLKKAHDYGTSWRVLRPISVADQIYIKARRISQLQQSQQQMIADDIPSEFIGIINYGIIGLIQLDLADDENDTLPLDTCKTLYEQKAAMARQLMLLKNHDYGEAWRQMSQESFADLILTKVYRMKQIIRNKGVTLASEGLDANYLDIINYAVFALILQQEEAVAGEK
ncbi:MAG TPA: DUF1599 domain-containing protein [Phnomibacter sp.]|nr:DUF1599 domain-containing protein [Phnomibacter sp.]